MKIEGELKHVTDLAEKARDLKIVTPAAEPNEVYYLHNPADGTYTRTIAEPEPRDYTVDRLDTLVALAIAEGPTAALWIEHWGATLVFNTASRRERARFVWRMSAEAAAFARLNTGASGRFHDHASFSRVLRLELAAALAGYENLIEQTESVALNTHKEGRATGGTRAQESMGQSIEATCRPAKGEKPYPAEVTLNLRFWEGSDFEQERFKVRAALLVDVTSGGLPRFAFAAIGDSFFDAVDRAVKRVVERLRAELKDQDVPIYFGNPNPTVAQRSAGTEYE